MSDEYLFISDCHLDARRPQVTTAVVEFLEQRAATARCVYILGDLFEVWLGDDDPAVEHQRVIEALQRLSARVEVFFMAGNRDFLLGQEFAAKTRITLLEEPFTLPLAGQPVVLIHGDTLCTDDHDYQAFRELVRSAQWQAEFLRKSLPERQQIAAELRSNSAAAMAQKSLEIMDVNATAVADYFRDSGAEVIIHGHTHRPGVHRYAKGLTRIVLGDWSDQPSYLSWTQDRGFNLIDPRV